jgi:hypothetical protein
MRILRFGIHALAFASLVILSGCFEKDPASEEEGGESEVSREEKADGSSVRGRLTALRAEKKNLETQLKGLKKAANDKPALVAKELELSTQLEEVRSYTSSLDSLESALDAGLEGWRPATRNSFKGVTLPEVTTTDGTNYTSVTIKEVTDENLVILHAGGEATVPILQLPVGLRRNLIHEDTVLAEQAAPAK